VHLFITTGNRGNFRSVLTTEEIWYSADEGVRKELYFTSVGEERDGGDFSHGSSPNLFERIKKQESGVKKNNSRTKFIKQG